MSSTKPTWAEHLPEPQDMDYVRNLLSTVFMLCVVAWFTLATLKHGPKAITKVAKAKVGVGV